MNPDDVRKWRLKTFSELVGAANRRRVQRLQKALLQGTLPSPLLIVGVYGFGKTSLVRLLLKSLNCRNRDPATADPCHVCTQCVCSGKYYFGHGDPYRRFEYDCASLDRAALIEELSEQYFEKDTVMFLDEFHRIQGKGGHELFLKFVEDYDGIFIAAVMEDRLEEIPPPLRERCGIVQLLQPEASEIADSLALKCAEWKISCEEAAIGYMVEQSGQSFRICHRILAAALEDGGMLTRQLVDEVLCLDR